LSTLYHSAGRAATPRPARVFALGLAAFGLTLAALILLLYTFPDNYDSFFFPLNPRGMHQFRAHLGLAQLPHLGFHAYSRAFRLLLVLLWSCYILAVAACLRGARPAFRPLLAAVALAAAAAALLEPPLLSSDVYANASHGRIFVLYGQNPYLWRPSGLLAFHDPVARFLSWDWPTIYGPVWTWIEIGVAALLRPFGLWTQIVGHKLLLAGALLVVALAGRRLAARFSPGRENLTFLAIGLNPMLLLEGPGTGHNDVVFLAFLMVGAVLYFEKKYIPALLCLGLSVGIKPFTLALLPWVLLDYSHGRTWRQALTATVAASTLVLLPLALSFAPLWGGAATLAPMQQRALYGQSTAVLARNLHFHAWLGTHGVGPLAASVLVSLSQNWLLAALYLALTVLLWKGRVAGGWLTAWALFSAALMFLLIVPAFPWYVAWFWPFCLLRWDRWHLGLSAACLILSLIWTTGYAMVTYSSTIHEHRWINMDGTESAQPRP
jgi:hypothetical protein